MIDLLNAINGVLWHEATLFVLLAAGVVFTVATRFSQWTILTHGVQVVRGVYDDPDDPGAINHFQALSAALSGTVGLGNIGGVALAIGIGGPGALFWMWIVAVFGMAVKAVEITLAMMYRNTDDPRKPSGGAMWVIEKTLGARGGSAKVVARIMGSVFCVTMIISTITGGNIFQAWNVATLTETYFEVPQMVTTIVLATIVGAVIIGGIERIGAVAGRLVPGMVFLYLAAALAVCTRFAGEIPSMLLLVVQSAFSPTEAGGAFVGAGIFFAFRIGMQRALFSNEAGQGSAPIAHAAAKTDEPAREGLVGGLGPFIDTIIICTLTALVILLTGTWDRDPVGDLAGDYSLVEVEDSIGEWAFEGPTAIDALPEVGSLDPWSAGDAFYLLAEVPAGTSLERGSSVVALDGEVVYRANENGTQSEDLEIAWSTVMLDVSEWAAEGILIPELQPGVYRSYGGAALTAVAFDRAFPGLGKWLVTLAAWLFALSTMISWSYYGEQGMVYLVGEKLVLPYKLVFLVAAAAAPIAASNVDALLAVIDFGTGAMLWGNIPILLLMGHLAVREMNRYNDRLRNGEIQPHEPRSIEDLVDE